MKWISRHDLKMLAQAEDGHAVSLYLPTGPVGEHAQQGSLRLRRLLKEVEAKLASRGLSPKKAGSLVEPAHELARESSFWRVHREGLALFLSRDFFLGCQTPYEVPELGLVSDGFHLKPLLPLISDDGHFFILALSRNEVKLYRVSRHDINEVPLEGVVQSEAEALRFDDPEKSLQSHAGQPAGSGHPTAIVHGHGAAKEQSKDRTLRFFRQVNDGLHPYLREEHCPLVLACVDYYLPLFREATTYPHLLDEVIAGNPENTPLQELHRAGLKKVEPLLAKQRNQARGEVEEALAKQRAVNDIEQAVLAAWHGRADLCFAALDQACWGVVDPDTAKVERLTSDDHPEARDLVDVTAVRTFVGGGVVYPVENAETVPGKSSVAVRLRY